MMRMAIASAYGEYRRVRVRTGIDRSALPIARFAATTMHRGAARLREWQCVLSGGHFKVLYTEPHRVALRCVGCGHQSPGWEISGKK